MEKVFFHVNLSTVEKYDLHFGTEKIYSMPYPIEKIEEIKCLLKSETYIDILKLRRAENQKPVSKPCHSFLIKPSLNVGIVIAGRYNYSNTAFLHQ